MTGHHNIRLLVRTLTLAAAAGAVIAGCGQQDLYEPPGSPYEIVGQLALPSINEGIDVLGTTAFVAAGEAGLHSIDFSNPSEPILLQTVNTTKYAYDINVIAAAYSDSAFFALTDVAHIIEGSEGVSTYDVTDPSNIEVLQEATTAVDAESTYIEESDDATVPYHVYLAESWHGLRVFPSIVNLPGNLTYEVQSSDPEAIIPHLFKGFDASFSGELKAGDIILGGDNFGCGSSREHPAVGLAHQGVKAVIVKSVNRIFYRSAVNQGLPLIVLPKAVDAYCEGDVVEIDFASGTVRVGEQQFEFEPLPDKLLEILEMKGLVNWIRNQ